MPDCRPSRKRRSAKAWWQAPKAKQLGIAAAAIGGAYLATFLQPDIEYWAFTLATVIAVWPIARKAFVAARYGAFFTIQMLMTIAAIGAVIIGEQEEAAVVILLFTLGEMLEGLAADRARSGIRALGKLLPRDALVEGRMAAPPGSPPTACASARSSSPAPAIGLPPMARS